MHIFLKPDMQNGTNLQIVIMGKCFWSMNLVLKIYANLRANF